MSAFVHWVVSLVSLAVIGIVIALFLTGELGVGG
jgi:hypothetical protein